MVVAFVLIETQLGKQDEILFHLRQLTGVKSAHFVTGPYDIIAILEMTHTSQLSGLIGGHIHTIHGIKKTVTCLVLDDPSAFEDSL